MPQYAIIKADGTGDYTTVEAWRAAEIKSNYGAMTIGVVYGLVQSGGALLFTKIAADDWPHGAGLVAADGQAYNGANLSDCARISHSSSVIEQGDVDFLIEGIYVIPTGGYNIKTFRFAANNPTTQRRKLTIRRCNFATAPFYHGSTSALYLSLVSGNANSQYELDIEDLVLSPRASNNAMDLAALAGNLDIIGMINRMTIAPTNTSGTGSQESVYVGPGSACTLALQSILALGSQSRTNYVDYVNAGFSGTVNNIVTADGTGDITGATGATQLEDVAAADYRLKSTSYGVGAFPQETGPVEPTPQDAVTTDAVARTFAAVLSASQTINLTGISARQRTVATAMPVTVASKPVAISSQQRAVAQIIAVSTKSEFTAVNASCRQSALSLTVSAAMSTNAAQSVLRSYVQQLEITDELQVRPAMQRAYAEVLYLAVSMQQAAVNSNLKTYASSLQISIAMQANSISVIQRSYADLLSNANGPAPINPQKLTATLATARLTATRLTRFLSAQIVTDNN
tara:strand:+ start:4313 stop:5857 length:1545 start_codon:yes stop_codon:yes gene_type:complete